MYEGDCSRGHGGEIRGGDSGRHGDGVDTTDGESFGDEVIGGGGVDSISEVMGESLMIEVIVKVEMVLKIEVFVLKVVDMLEGGSCYLILSISFLCEMEGRKLVFKHN